MIKRYRPLLSFALIFFIFGIILLLTARSLSANSISDDIDPFGQSIIASEKLSEYTFVAQIEQTLIPRAIPLNVGATEQRIDSQLTGEVGGDSTRFTWAFEASAGAPPIVMEQAGDQFFLLNGDERTEIENPLAGIAPSTDFGTYLRAAQNIRPSEITHPDFTVYDFDFDGEALAKLILAETDRHLSREQQALFAANTAYLKNIIGDGQLYVDADGLPRRQTLTINMPEINEQYDVRTNLTVDFQYTSPQPTPIPLSNQSTPLATTMARFQPLFNAFSEATTFDWLFSSVALTLSALAGVSIAVAGSHRKLRVIVPIFISLAIFLTPILQPVAMAHQYRVAEASRPATLLEALGFDDDDLAEAELELNAVEPSDPSLATNQFDPISAAACGSGDEGLDTDGDGLNDFVENCLGTSPFELDTDGDGLTDTLEVNGFIFTDTLNTVHTIYTNPHEADSNEDGLIDILEWTDPGLAFSIDMDGDNLPNPWDFDNDGDLIPDGQDLDPFAVSDYQSTFSIVTTRDGDTFDGFQYIDIQVQPEDKDHLRLSTTALDWPYDELGTLQARDPANLGELTFSPQLKITTNKVPYEYLQNDYGISAIKRGGVFEMYVSLLPVTDGGQITGYSSRVVYDLNQFTTLNWSKVEFVWTAMMEVSLDDGSRTRVTPVAVYEEPSFRLTGLQITKNSAQDIAVIGTPAQQTDHRLLANTLFGTSGLFLNNPDIDFDAFVDRLTDPNTPLDQTWGVPVADIAVSTGSPPHPDSALKGFHSLYRLSDDFLKGNSYDVNSVASLIVATELSSGYETLEEAADLSADTFTFNLANIPTQSMRSVTLNHYRYTSSNNWDAAELNDVLPDLLGHYDDATFETIRTNLAQSYPLIDIVDMADIMVGFYLSWSVGQVNLMSLDGTEFAEPISDEAINQQFNLPTEQDFVTYLIEALEFGVIGQSVVFATPQTYHEYSAAFIGKSTGIIIRGTGAAIHDVTNLYILINDNIKGKSLGNFIAEKIRDKRFQKLVTKAKKAAKAQEPNQPTNRQENCGD